MNSPLDVVGGIFRPEILDCIDPLGEFLCDISFMELSVCSQVVVITTVHVANMCIEENHALAPLEASALAILWHSPFKVGRIGPTVVINCLVKRPRDPAIFRGCGESL